MKVLIDACVLYPTVLRELVLGVAAIGAFEPLWSDRILEEWRHAAARRSDRDGQIAEGEIALAKAKFPGAVVPANPATETQLHLPDEDDIHVLAAAIEGRADALLTLNIKDFPTNTLAEHGILRRHPDEFLLEKAHADRDSVQRIVQDVLSQAGAHGIDVSNPRALLKRAKLPRLGKLLFPRQNDKEKSAHEQ